MARFLFLVILIAVGYLLYHLYGKQLLKKSPKSWIKPLLALLLALIVLAVATGRASAILAVLGGMVAAIWRAAPLLMRFYPQLRSAFHRFRNQTSAEGPVSKVTTLSLVMTLNHDTGEIDGQITRGQFVNRLLSSLSLEEIRAYVTACEQQDPDAMPLLKAFIEREHPDWTMNANAGAAPPQSGDMSPEEALAILGLETGATSEQITLAHRKLMAKLHPDKGGSTYLATRVNQAKDLLMKSANP